MTKLKLSFIVTGVLIIGILLGGYMFRKTIPRSFIALDQCDKTCLNKNELAGLIASVGIQLMPGVLPDVIKETEKTIVLKHPFPQSDIHYVVIPKKDIKDISSISDEDQEYIQDIFKTIAVIVNEQQLTRYQVITNGPGYQHVTYLHFHLQANN